MPNIKSAKKRVLVNESKRQQNRAIISEVKTAIKKFNAAIDTNNIQEAERLLPLTMSAIDSAAAKGVIHKNNAANKKSNLSKRLSDVKSGKIVIEIKKDNKTIAAQKALAAKEARDAVRAENAKKAAERQALKAAEEEAKSGKKTTKKDASKEVKEAAKKEKDAVKKEKKPAKIKDITE